MEQRVLFVTGASTGIGAAAARRASASGWRVALAARSADKLEALARDLGGPERAIAVPCDVSDWDAQADAISRTVAAFGRIDAAWANAGFSKGSTFASGDPSPGAWREMVLANVYGAAATARLAIPELRKTKGRLLFTGSVVGRFVSPGSLYSATKWAVTAMAETIRQELNGTGIRVTLICPGRVDTPFWTRKPPEPTLTDDDVARAALFALEQPEGVDLNEILVRPVGQKL